MSFVIAGPRVSLFQGFLHHCPLWLGETRQAYQGVAEFHFKPHALRCLARLRERNPERADVQEAQVYAVIPEWPLEKVLIELARRYPQTA